MTTIKSYTDLSQSLTLSKILPLESADMYYDGFGRLPQGYPYTLISPNSFEYDKPCWSLAALLGTLAENKICHYDDRYYCQYMSKGDEFPIYSTAEYDNPVDACVAMIEKLNELNLL